MTTPEEQVQVRACEAAEVVAADEELAAANRLWAALLDDEDD